MFRMIAVLVAGLVIGAFAIAGGQAVAQRLTQPNESTGVTVCVGSGYLFGSFRVIDPGRHCLRWEERIGLAGTADLAALQSALDTRVGGLEARIEALETGGGTADLEDRVAALEGSVGTLEGTVMTLGGDYDALASRVNTVETATSGFGGRIVTLEGATGELQTRFDGVSRSGSTLLFSGMNVQLVNGSGYTAITNGLGNLVIGYNSDENDGVVDTRTGSHYLVIGDDHTYTSYGGIVAGYNNNVTGIASSILGGSSSTASGRLTFIGGGFMNQANGDASAILGGAGRVVDTAYGTSYAWP